MAQWGPQEITRARDAMKTGKSYTLLLALALVFGAGAGMVCHNYAGPDTAAAAMTAFGMMSQLFLRLIKMIIAPLVLCTLAGGIGRLGSGAALGRIAGKALLLFIAGSLVSLALGAVAGLLLEPGAGLHLAEPGGSHVSFGAVDFSGSAFIERAIPSSVFGALASNAVLQIAVVSVLVGFALIGLGSKAKGLVTALESIAELTLLIARYVMYLAPVGVFGAMAGAFAARGTELFTVYGRLVAEFYGVLALICAALFLEGVLFLRGRVLGLIRETADAVILGWSTSSSEVAYPKLYSGLQHFGVPSTVISFVVPFGYSFNSVGSMAYCAFAVLFVVQAVGAHLGTHELLIMLGMIFVMSKGVANVPRAALIIIISVLQSFNLPEAGIALIVGIDVILDMGRTGVNIFANAVATAAVSQWDASGALGTAVCRVERMVQRMDRGQ